MIAASITTEERLTVVKHLAEGKTPKAVSELTRLPRTVVVDIGSHHGYPDTDKLAWAADILQKNLDAESQEPAEAPQAAPGDAAELAAVPDSLHDLLDVAKGHPSKRIQNAADRIFDGIATLRRLVAEDEEKHAEKRRLAAEREAAKAEVKRLQDELAEARRKLNPRPSRTPGEVGDGPSAKEIRAWAATAGIAVPAVGRVPADVRAAYDAAHPVDVAS